MEETKVARRDSIQELTEQFNDQDFKQKMGMYTSFIMEFYRVIMGSFLLVVVPQKCGDEICGLDANISTNNIYKNIVFAFNTLTCVMFLHLYYAEMKRENKMINYLHVNPELPRDNDAVGDVLVKLPKKKHDNILYLDKYYQKSGKISFLCFFINAVLSSVVVFSQYLDDKTITVFLTNFLFMATKVYDTKVVTDTEENIFLSAYLTRRIQYNDVDPDKIKELEEDEIEVEKVEELVESKKETLPLKDTGDIERGSD